MNLTKIKQIGNLRDLVVEFLVNNPEATYPDQDAFNVLFHNNILYLDSSWNQFVYSHREENIDTLNPGIYHFAADVLVVYSNSKIGSILRLCVVHHGQIMKLRIELVDVLED